MRRFYSALFVFLSLSLSVALGGSEYFVGKQGDDAGTGLSEEAPFLTIGKGLSMLKAGDTLTIAPGEYEEANSVNLPTERGAPITIRAAIPGTVLIRGDRSAGEFEKVDGFRFVWKTAWDKPVETVNERDTLKMYDQAATVEEMDNRRAVWHLDAESKELYIVTTDSMPPAEHTLTVSVERNFGLIIQDKGQLYDVVIEGLSFTGFNCNEAGLYPGNNGRWGLYLLRADGCVVRDCTAFLNGGGIGVAGATDTVIEDCVAYANGSQFCGTGGNIVIYGSAFRSVIRRCVAFSSSHAGLRFYGGKTIEDCLIEDCVAWDNGYDGVWIKGSPVRSRTVNTVTLEGMHSELTENTIYRYNGYSEVDPTSLKIANNRLPFEEHVADPSKMDYRPMSDSGIKGGLKDRGDVFFVSPEGDDSNPGTTIRAPWRSLRRVEAGSTVYLQPGVYEGGQVLTESGVTLRTRGDGASAVFKGGEFGLVVAAENVCLENLAFVGASVAGLKISGGGARVVSCGFADQPTGVEAQGRRGLLIAHNAFADSLSWSVALSGCAGVLRDNLFAAPAETGDSDLVLWNNHETGKASGASAAALVPLYADPGAGDFTMRNAAAFAGRGSDGLALGPYRLIRGNRPVRITGPFVRSLTATTANLEWWTDRDGVTGELRWGTEESAITNKAGSAYGGRCFHTVSLTGLEPGRRYFFRVLARTPPFEIHSNLELEAADKLRKREVVSSETMSFATMDTELKPREYFVAKDGDDAASGSLEAPWRSIGYGLGRILAGDTLTIRGGVYREQLYARASGDEGRRITIRGAEGEKVWLDGKSQMLRSVFQVYGKNHILFDNLYIRNLGSTREAAFVLLDSDDITLNRIFYDGRANNYTPGLVSARFCARLTLANSFFTRGFHGATFFSCPDLTVRNNVMYFNQIDNLSVHNKESEAVYIANNIIFDTTLQKVRNPIIRLWHLESLKDSRNCFYVRIPASERTLYGYSRLGGELVAGEGRLNLEQLLELPGRGEPSFIANPRVPALDETISFADLAEWQANWESLGEEHRTREYKKTAEGFAPLDFADFIPANPLCRPGVDGEPIGFDLTVQ